MVRAGWAILKVRFEKVPHMQEFHYRDLDKYIVDAEGRVRLPKHKQQALHRLAWQQGQGGVKVTSIQTYQQALLAIFDLKQREYIEEKLNHYHTHGFATHLEENLAGFSEESGLSADQDLAWLDFLGVMTQHEALR